MILAACLIALTPADEPKADNTGRAASEPLYYLVWRGDSVLRRAERGDSWKQGSSRLGWFDADGNFVPDARLSVYREGQAPHSNLSSYTMPGFSGPIKWRTASAAGANHPAYEHRSGRLISGVATPKGFVPDIGSKVLDLKGYDYKKDDRAIWNMIDEETAKYYTERRREKFPDGPIGNRSPPGQGPPKAGIPEGFEFHLYRTFMKSEPWFARVIGDVMELGHLNDEGEFIPDYGLPVLPFEKRKEPGGPQ